MRKRIFIGQFVSEEESYLDKRISQAGNNYQLKFIDIVNPFLSLSLVPTFFNRSKIVNDKPKVKKLTSYSNNRGVMILENNFKAFKLIKKEKPDSIWCYNITTSNFVVCVLLRYFTSYKLYFVVADYYNTNTWLQKMFQIILSVSAGSIVLNSNISKELNCKTKVLPGILKDIAIELNISHQNNCILFSGSLGKTTGFELALKFANSNPKYTLYITGVPYQYTKQEFQDLLDLNKSKNIIYKGQLSYTEYIVLLNKCTYAFSLRDPSDLQHDYNFPSKILEYLSKGKIVISTKVYPEIKSDFYFKSDSNIDSLTKTFNKINEGVNIDKFRQDLYDYVKTNFSSKSLNETILNLEQ